MKKGNNGLQFTSAIDYINSYSDKLYDKYSFLALDYDKFNSLLRDKIAPEAEQAEGNNIVKKVNKVLLDYVKEYLSSLDSEALCSIINNFIVMNLTATSDPTKMRGELEKLSKFINAYSIILSVDVCKYLVDKNEIVKNYFDVIFKKYIKDIESGRYTDSLDDNNIITLVEVCADLNGIEINYDIEEVSSDDGKDLDSEAQYCREVYRLKLLSYEEERDLGYRILDGDEEAKKTLAAHNLRLVLKMANRYRCSGVKFLDLVQEGNMGLMVAVDRFDVRKGFRFSTYATHWIRQYISRSIDNDSRNIRLPVHMSQKLSKFNRAKEELSSLYGRTPTTEELMKTTGFNEKTVENLSKLAVDTIPLNKLISDEEDGDELGDFISDDKDNAEAIFINNKMVEDVRNAISSGIIKPRELRVLELRFGIKDGQARTLEEVGQLLHVTRERIRQIEGAALRKLFNNRSFRMSMRDYIDISTNNPKYNKIFNDERPSIVIDKNKISRKAKQIDEAKKKQQEAQQRKQLLEKIKTEALQKQLDEITKCQETSVETNKEEVSREDMKKIVSSVRSNFRSMARKKKVKVEEQPKPTIINAFTVNMYEVIKDKLDEQTSFVMALISGAKGDRQHSLSEIASLLGMTELEVKDIYNKAYKVYQDATTQVGPSKVRTTKFEK
ncbi:MAG: sigma-70 family RNA polymerase sigma factor [Bacilli bacterium]|nr:sigma-70 family RNA polymerase sigma factor [Bacilli bacterium]